ncbi:hypothetical protein [Fulvivirga lutimaris]|uniref:hypothetical protein n=1 Tax=Fulvivirga lutimaris TaxID=1819566 RepID=UPI0012BCCFC0|nr:hypothetical protein [Fulvivirga lutimaris]MTI41600.1 hypothetical protein [Fulvivirga lutimaris]
MKSISPERIRSIRVITLCVVAAATFWFLNALNDTYSTTLKYPLVFSYDTEKYIPLEQPPEYIQINVSGIGWNLFRNSLGIKVTPVNFKLQNASEFKKIPGNSILGTLSDQLDEFNVNFILTDTLYVNIDTRASRRFKLAIDSSAIKLNEQYWLSSSLRYSPDSVTLQGPESILSQMDEVLTISIPQSDIDENYNEDIPIEFENSRLISRDPPTMNVVFGVEEYTSSEIDVPLTLENFPENKIAFVTDTIRTLIYNVGINRADNIAPDQFSIVANYNKINPEDSTITLEVTKHPEFTKDVHLDSAKVKVKFNE